MKYKLINGIGNEPTAIYDTEKLMSIPFEPANIDYQEYLKWLAEGNTPEPADEPEGE